MSIIVGGGTGFIGQCFAKLASDKGYKVISVSRTAGENRMTWDDLSKNGLPEDCVAVINMCGEKIFKPFQRWNPEMKARFHSSRIGTTNKLKEAICRAEKKPKAFIVLTAISAYKPDPTTEYTEETVVAPYDYLSQLTAEWEEAAKLPESVPTRSVIVRVGVVMGNEGGMIQNLKTPFYLGLGGPLGSGKQWLSWIHIADMIGIVMHAVENDKVTGVLNGTSPNPVSSGEFTKTYATALGRPHLFWVPEFVVRMVLGNEESTFILDGPKVLPKRVQDLGYSFKFPDAHSACKDLVS